MAKRKTPKNSNKKGRKRKEKQNHTRLSIFIVFIIVVAFIFYFVNTFSSDEDVVAVVNGEKITVEEFNWWYKLSVLPEQRDSITKQDFLVGSLLPLKVMVQQAERENIKVTEDDVEKLIGLFIINSGMTLEEFEDDLRARDITNEDIRKSFETNAMILGLTDKVGISYDQNKLFDDENEEAFNNYLEGLYDTSDIEIFEENINKLVLSNFEATGDEICDKEKPVLRLYTASWCEVCGESSKVFENLVEEFVEDGRVKAFHWSLDTGDNLLTKKKEKGVPQEEVALFERYSPDNRVPTVVLGCKYERIGNFGDKEADEFKAIVKTLIEG